tara:strand:- start:23 stop:211 length:189 start_codon:yes stop_codon:yes gene_type:complete
MAINYYLNKNIENTISNNPGINKNKIYKNFNEEENNIKKSLSYLEDKGVVYEDKNSNRYYHT